MKEALHIHLIPLQPGCWPGTAWLLGFHSQGFAREATIGLIGKGFPPFFSTNELHGLGVFFILIQSEPVIFLSLYKPPHHVSFLVEFCIRH